MLDSQLAELYGVSTKALNQAVKRNRDRFPGDFMFQLNKEELADWTSQLMTSKSTAKASNLKSQFVTSSYGGRRKFPYAFTEQGVAMLSSVLKNKRAVQVNIMIMRAFVKLREIMATHLELAHKIESLETKYAKHDKHIQAIFRLIKELLAPPPEPIEPESEKSPMGFQPPKK